MTKTTVMQKSIIFGFIAAILLVIFATQNIEPVELHLFWGDPIKGSLSLITLISVFIGVILGFIFSYPAMAKVKKQNKEQLKEIEKLKDLLATYKEEAKETHLEKEKPAEKDEF